jgi:hypothetical protein
VTRRSPWVNVTVKTLQDREIGACRAEDFANTGDGGYAIYIGLRLAGVTNEYGTVKPMPAWEHAKDELEKLVEATTALLTAEPKETLF